MTHNQINCIEIDKNIIDCDIDHYPMIAKVRDRLSVINEQCKSLIWRHLISRSYMMWKLSG
jgi:hypothetical protein